MIKQFDKPTGRYIESIPGQERLAFAHSDGSDLYDLVEWAERGGYPGSVLQFYDFTTGKVYKPFRKKRDVMYSDPIYADGRYWFLQADHAKQMVTLFSWLPEEKPKAETALAMADVDLYNLRLLGEGVHVMSQDAENATCYYPECFSIPLTPQQTVALIEDDHVYLEEWVEEGWDEENDCAGENYRFYTKVIVKDFAGNTLSEQVGSIAQAPDGSYWLA